MTPKLLDAMCVVCLAGQAAAQCSSLEDGITDLRWYPPNSTEVNSLSSAINGTGIYGFIFNSSQTPNTSAYTTYNWCNMPHIRPQEYIVPPKEFKLQYVEIIHRHHKRTPYASNTFPEETYSWSCDDEALFFYGIPRPGGTAARVNWQVYTSESNPFQPDGFKGTCQFPQITCQGLDDSRQHGKDLFDVYSGVLDFIPKEFNDGKVTYRVTNNVITSQVVGQVIQGFYPSMTDRQVRALIQPYSIDSLEPRYPCKTASDLYSSYGVGSDVANWTVHLDLSTHLFAKLDSVSGVNDTDPGWHNWFDHYFDNLSARLCHDKLLPCQAQNASNCVSQEDADAVFRRGQYEYSFIYRDAPKSLAASTASFGVWIGELAANIRVAMNEGSQVIYRHNIAHDGSMARLLSILQVDVMVWPGMGAEIAFELYSRDRCYYLRVLFGGQVLRSSNPSLGRMDLIPAADFLAYIDGLVGTNGSRIPILCSGE